MAPEPGEPVVRPSAFFAAPRRRPTTYPGTAPDYPYLLADGLVQPLRVERVAGSVRVTLADGTPVDDVLRRHGVAPLAGRIPSVAYGANRGPESLALKFDHHGSAEAPPIAPVVPVLAVTVSDVDAVGGGITKQGFVYADIVDSPGTRLSVLLPLFDRRQLAAVHDSEGVGKGYDCAWLTGIDLTARGGGSAGTLAAMAYVRPAPVFRDPRDDQPLAFAAVAAEGRRFPALAQVAMLARVVEATGIAARLAPLLGRRPDAEDLPAEAVAEDLIRLLNGQWWYRRHNRPDDGLVAAARAFTIVNDAMAGSPWPRPPDSPLTRDVLPRDEAYDPPPARQLGHLLPLV